MESREERQKDSWDAFFHSGKVEDYLRYASCKAGESGFYETTKGAEDKPYAGIYTSDRDHIETDTYR